MTDNIDKTPDTPGTPQKDKQFKRSSYSDRFFPGGILIAALAILVVAAVLYVSYNVFQLETQRRELNEARSLLDNRQQDIAEARKKRAELNRLKNDLSAIERELDKRKGDVADAQREKDFLDNKIDSINNEITDLQNRLISRNTRILELKNEQADLKETIADLKSDTELARRSESRAKSRVEEIMAVVESTAIQRNDLLAEVARLEAQKATLEEVTADQELIREVRNDLDLVLSALNEKASNIDGITNSLKTVTESFSTSAGSTLGGLTRQVTTSADLLEKEMAALSTSVNLISTETETITDSRTRFEKSSSELGQLVQRANDSISTSLEEISSIRSSFTEKTDEELLKISMSIATTIGSISEETARLAEIAELMSAVVNDVSISKSELSSKVDLFDLEIQKAVGSVTSSALSLKDAVIGVQSATTAVSENSDALDQQISNVDVAAKSLTSSSSPVMSSTEEIKDAAYKLTLAVVNFSDRIEGMQKRIEGINEELPSADAASNRLQQLLNEIDFAKTESAASSNALRTLTEQLKNAVGSYIAEMDDAQVRLDAAATYLESVASTISESSSSTPDPSNNSTVSPEAPENDEKGE